MTDGRMLLQSETSLFLHRRRRPMYSFYVRLCWFSPFPNAKRWGSHFTPVVWTGTPHDRRMLRSWCIILLMKFGGRPTRVCPVPVMRARAWCAHKHIIRLSCRWAEWRYGECCYLLFWPFSRIILFHSTPLLHLSTATPLSRIIVCSPWSAGTCVWKRQRINDA